MSISEDQDLSENIENSEIVPEKIEEIKEKLPEIRHGNVGLLHKINLVWLAMAILVIPVWYYTTTVERSDIPYDEINRLNIECEKLVSTQKR